jgi:hypothetical protein
MRKISIDQDTPDFDTPHIWLKSSAHAGINRCTNKNRRLQLQPAAVLCFGYVRQAADIKPSGLIFEPWCLIDGL